MGHCHDHHHHLASPTAAVSSAFALAAALNAAFVAIEVGFGLYSGSLALLADAGHNLSDVLGLLLAWGASYLMRQRPSRRRTYGLGRTSILAALVNAILLLVAVGAIAWEAVHRLREPGAVMPTAMIAVAACGVVLNTATALLFLKGRHHDLNVRGAFLHMAADAAVSLGVVIGGLAVSYTGWAWIDPALGLVIALVIAISTWDLFRQAVNLALDSVPAHIDPELVHRYLAELPGVTAVHDLHIWALSTTETALTAHLVKPTAVIDDDWLYEVSQELAHRFGIAHSTIQLESGGGVRACRLAPDDVV
jgi:cobalt-zinc-cadmium efflux system protein